MDEKRKGYHNEIKRKGYPKLGERDENNVAIISLVHINKIDDLQIVISWGSECAQPGNLCGSDTERLNFV